MKILPEIDLEGFYELLKEKSRRPGWTVSIGQEIVKNDDHDQPCGWESPACRLRYYLFFSQGTCRNAHKHRTRLFQRSFVASDASDIDLTLVLENALRFVEQDVRPLVVRLDQHELIQPVLLRRKLRLLLKK